MWKGVRGERWIDRELVWEPKLVWWRKMHTQPTQSETKEKALRAVHADRENERALRVRASARPQPERFARAVHRREAPRQRR